MSGDDDPEDGMERDERGKAIWSDRVPEPDRSLVPGWVNQRVVEVVYSRCGGRRAVVTCDEDDVFRVMVEDWAVREAVAGRYRYMGLWGVRDSSVCDGFPEAMAIAMARTLVGGGGGDGAL
jgi:hypothetical protein